MSMRRLKRSNAMAFIPDGQQTPTTASVAPATLSRKRKAAVVLSASEDEGSGTPTVVDSDSEDGPPPSPARMEHMEVTPPPSTHGQFTTGRNAVSASPVDNRTKRQRRRGEDPALEEESPTPGATAAALALEGLNRGAYRAKHQVYVEIPVKRGRGRPRKTVATVTETETKMETKTTTSTKASKSKGKGKAKQVEIRSPSPDSTAPSGSTSSRQHAPKPLLEQDDFFMPDDQPLAPIPFLPPLPIMAPASSSIVAPVVALPDVAFIGPPFWKKRHEQPVNGFTLYIAEAGLQDLMASKPEDFQCTMKIKTFTKAGIYVNFGRIAPDVVRTPDGGKTFLALNGFKQPVVGIMIGLVLSSYLRTVGPGPEKTDGTCAT
ncbi:hypothetical protein BDN72DRAFT_905056, partial [Pluteus cervinus]